MIVALLKPIWKLDRGMGVMGEHEGKVRGGWQAMRGGREKGVFTEFGTASVD